MLKLLGGHGGGQGAMGIMGSIGIMPAPIGIIMARESHRGNIGSMLRLIVRRVR